MPSRSSIPIGDTVLGIATLAFAVFLYWGSLDIPPPFFDPLGSAAVPKGCAVIIGLLGGAALFRALPGLRSRPAREAAAFRPRPDIAAGLVVLAAAYVLMMEMGWMSFRWSTAGFVFLAGLLLGGLSVPVALISLGLAALMGFGGQYLFTQVFFIDLPM